ncbi:MAG: GntR family transcriptional regulator [Provencibacterium sp.]|jgi:DNA-binding GntR family transcriptional regulator|nr:GntR family transcriptional regulator [Provencibacterium sp.]
MKPETGASNSETIYQTLRGELLSLAVKPGQPLPENEVCTRFGVSRTPVRTAFQRLQAEGLLTIEPYKSTYASLLDFEDIEQRIYLRVAVESAVLKDALETLDRLTEEKIRYNLRRQAVLLCGEAAPQDFYRIDSSLHAIWFHFLHKDSLWQTIQQFEVNYTRFRMLDIVAEKSCAAIYEEHLGLFSAIQARNFARLQPLLREHLYGGMNRLRGRISEEFADYFVRPPQPGGNG